MMLDQEHRAARQLATADNGDLLLRDTRNEIIRLTRLSGRGLRALALFLLVSLLAWLNFPLLPAPEAFIARLGRPPSPAMISTALLTYIFFAITLSLGRMMTGIENRSSFCHVAYLAVFYFFYHVTKTLDDNYWAVFCSGITILGIESYRIRAYCQEAISRQTERLAHIERTGRDPDDY
jgi:hypothetical protein